MLSLKTLDVDQRTVLIIKLLQEQVVDQRKKLAYWRDLTKQPSQIDTGYISQYLLSLITSIYGGLMRGKGTDLDDGSEIKAANFLDSLDKKGATAPRWNLSSNNLKTMESFLSFPALYLVSMDLNPAGKFRTRVWKLDPNKHILFRKRYLEWMEKLGKVKLGDPGRPGINFQLFPPHNKTDESFARHGNGRTNGFSPIKIELEGVQGAKKILHAEENNGVIEVIYLDSNITV
ncbi:hypothetical protein A2422_02990 [Candidatus Woesebacteria bacterium RIFOXYC1_FULL_31_51]|nr:MAG: Type-2 restriction enzyme MamI [Candidatus Woesebacteria bacterium GW2011_GWF1_31_35]KKP23402.1 MAG: Type-2 restriction enzyme MamI [Candidatus Woesebacteria bacterium GW2011_GWC1_30_29]KKP25060.1 MAG: Type-2 restriction enzyme MamI [Candidatus Woesebacteria bacterium GW2011_GWD1_31_12]KKP27678.1 MAG: Type-2 restriction enzyme MamI [Candidatus Woesebacteria bacterium GW2011_GWB1_31_29]KKP34282.1 MAG: Type-2 restriction enzyme MamI [Candidatus Woesebacteria bacterium GW2011_GWF2_32_16]K